MSCYARMNHVTHWGVVSHKKESCHIRMHHVTHEWFIALTNGSRNNWMSHVTQEDFIQPIHPCVTCVSKKKNMHVCQLSDMWHICDNEWVTSQMNESRHKQMSHVTQEYLIQRIHLCVTCVWIWWSTLERRIWHLCHISDNWQLSVNMYMYFYIYAHTHTVRHMCVTHMCHISDNWHTRIFFSCVTFLVSHGHITTAICWTPATTPILSILELLLSVLQKNEVFFCACV